MADANSTDFGLPTLINLLVSKSKSKDATPTLMKSKRSRKKDTLAPLSVAGAALSELMTFVDLSVAAVKDAAQARHILYWNRMAKRVLGERDPYTVWQLVDCGALLRQWSMI